MWGYFVGKEDSGKGAAVFSENLVRSMDSGTGCNYLNNIRKGDSQRDQILETQIRTAKRNQQRTVWKNLHLVVNVFVSMQGA